MRSKVTDDVILSLCLTGKTQVQIAEEMGMSKVQICRRINSANFQSLLSDYRKRIIDGVLTELTASAQKSVQTLVKLLDDKNPFIRLQAACKILSLSQDYSVQKDILNDIAEWREKQSQDD